MSGKVILGLNNRIDSAALSSTATFDTRLPLTNVQNHKLAKVARSTTASAFSVTASFTALAARSIGVVAIAGHNLSVAATVQVQIYQGAMLVDDSGLLSPWPYLANDDPHFLAHTYGAAIIDAERAAKLMPTLAYFLPANKAANKVVITIDDATNGAGYIEIGRIFVGDCLSPALNVEYGAVSYAHLDFSEIQATKRHVKSFNKYKPIRTATAAFKDLTEGEAFGGVYAAQRDAGLTGELIWAPDKPIYKAVGSVLAVDSNWFSRCFLANFTALDGLTQPYLESRSGAVNVEEVAV